MCLEIQEVLKNRILKAQQNDEKNIIAINEGYLKHIEETDKKIFDLYEKALNRREKDYQSRVFEMKKARTIADFEQSRDSLIKMDGYKDTLELAQKCQDEIDNLKKKEELLKIQQEAEQKKQQEIKEQKVNFVLYMIGGIILVCFLLMLYQLQF